MTNSEPLNYNKLPTQELENMLRLPINGEEKMAIRKELDRRYTERLRQEAEPAGEEVKHTPKARYTAGNPQGRQQYGNQPSPPPLAPPGPGKGQRHGYRPPPLLANGQQRLQHSAFRPAGTNRLANTNRLAIVSLVLGIFWFFWLGSIAGLIVGFIALKQIKTYNQRGRGFAIAGIVTSALWLLALLGS